MKKTIVFIGLCCMVMLMVGSPSVAQDPPPPPPEIDTLNACIRATLESNVYILDIRTPEEWKWVGHPGPNTPRSAPPPPSPPSAACDGALLAGKVVNIPIKLESRTGGPLVLNRSFLSDVNERFEDIEGVVLIAMCRSGTRGVPAANALIGAGYEAYNMTNGFEGKCDSLSHRSLNGWKIEGLPYTHSGAGYRD